MAKSRITNWVNQSEEKTKESEVQALIFKGTSLSPHLKGYRGFKVVCQLGVNFTNILRVAFSYESFAQSFFVL
jgi:hypothetical protein